MTTRYYTVDHGDIMESDGKVWQKVGLVEQIPDSVLQVNDDPNIQPFSYAVPDINAKTAYSKAERAVSKYIYGAAFSAVADGSVQVFIAPHHGMLRIFASGANIEVMVNDVEILSSVPTTELTAVPLVVIPGDVVWIHNSEVTTKDIEVTFLPYVYPVTPMRLYDGAYRLQDSNNTVNFSWTTDAQQDRRGVINLPGSTGWGYVFLKVPRALLHGNKLKLQWSGNYTGGASATAIYWFTLWDGEVNESAFPDYGNIGVGTTVITSRAVAAFEKVDYTSNVLDLSTYVNDFVGISVAVQGGWNVNESVWFNYLKLLNASNVELHDFDIVGRTFALGGNSGRSEYGTLN